MYNNVCVGVENYYEQQTDRMCIIITETYTVFTVTLTWHGAAQHDTIQHGPRLHTIIIWGVGWAFEQNGGGKNPGQWLCLYSVPV